MTDEAGFIEKLINDKYQDKAFKHLLDLYQERLYWHIRKLVITHDNANDVLQETFIRIYKSLPKFKQQSSLHTWMYKIAYNESIRFLENNKKKYHASIDDISEQYLEDLMEDVFFEGNEIQLKLQRILLKLPEKQRQIFQLKYYDELKFKEIETIIGINENTIKTSYYAAVKMIERNIESVDLFIKYLD
ncbi:MAG: RNA polymerase sigma factor [Flavobacteriaceae bacterium]|nr:RNA polymerase sigma factor [Flavobacteriaceae bacterium]